MSTGRPGGIFIEYNISEGISGSDGAGESDRIDEYRPDAD